ncbi:DHA2 family efflux MFS transporter permease subunit [Zunongwangia sp.]|uniref:DHA2 family efflux MFS transporter permease subunit n=1 Tax=Zunongwangia sp. TaxID=1965325 RepID=UPI003AA8FCCE
MKKESLNVSLIVGGAFLMENIDSTAITTALKQMSVDFEVDPITMSMGITSYVIMLAVFIPISGWIADRYGTKTVFSSAMAGFIISSVLCGLSQSLPFFIGARIFQGISGAMMVPVGRLAVLHNTEKKDLVTAIAYITWPGLAGPIIGPFLGGFFTTYLSWHWIFFVNVPIGILCILLALKYIPNKEIQSKRPLDWIGFLLSGTGLLVLMIGIELSTEKDADFLLSIMFIVGALIVLVISVWHSFKVKYPIINYSVLKIRTFRIPIMSGTVNKIMINSAPYLLPLFFQISFGLNAFDAGLLYMSSMVGNLVMKPATIWITRKYNFQKVLTINGFLLATAVFAQSFLDPKVPYGLIIALLFVSGLTRSMQFSSLNTLAYSDVDPEQMSNANTLYSTMQKLSIALGIALGAASLHVSTTYHGNGIKYQIEDFQLALTITAVVGYLAIIQYFNLKRDDGLSIRIK